MDVEIIYKYFPDLSAHQKNQFEQLHPIYLDWNSKINVVSRKDIDQLYLRHVLHSLAIAKFIAFKKGTKVLDIGTGGGFPGIPLAIFFPNVSFHLVDSVGKKIKVVEAIGEKTNLKNLRAEHQRAEKVNGQFDFVVSRAVARAKPLYQWTKKKIKRDGFNELKNGFILLKGGDLADEMKELGRSFTQENLSAYYEEDFFDTKKIIYLPS